jgi:hypothetical protein
MKVFFDGGFMGLRPIQGDEKRLLPSNTFSWKRCPPLCHPERSRGICSSADLSWKCVSTVALTRTLKPLMRGHPASGQNQLGTAVS